MNAGKSIGMTGKTGVTTGGTTAETGETTGDRSITKTVFGTTCTRRLRPQWAFGRLGRRLLRVPRVSVQGCGGWPSEPSGRP